MFEEDEQFFSAHEQTNAPATPDLSSVVVRMVLFVSFTLIEYVISWRILIEGGLMAAFYFIFLRASETGIDAEKFFSLTGIFTLALTIYTTSSVIGLGDRPQGYVVLSRRVGRTTYLLSFYLVAMLIITAVYGTLSLTTALWSQFTDLTITGWLLGTLPLMLNIGLMAALILMLSPLVLSTGWRLFVLGLIALAFSKNFLGNALIETFPPAFTNIIDGLQTILGWPMVPAFSGFALAMSRDYSGNAPAILIAQSSLLAALLGLAIYSFSRRELVLSTE
jgi:hypothetical protein